MNHRNILFCILSLCSAALMISPSTVLAGTDSGSPAYANFNPDGSGWCYGTMNGFRVSPASPASLAFEEYESNGHTSGYITCDYLSNFKYAPLNTGDAAQITMFRQIIAMSHEVTVYVHWNTSGIVDVLQVYNTSAYH